MRKLILAAASIAALSSGRTGRGADRRSSSSSATWWRPTRRRAWRPRSSRNWPRSTPSGKVKVEVYPNSQLYKDKEELEALQLGAVQMLAPSNSKFGPIGVKEFEVFDLPYILPDLKTLRKVTDGPLGAKLLKLLDSKGMTGLAYWDNGFKQMSANKKLVAPAGLQGPEIPHSVFQGAGSAVPSRSGSIPQVMAFCEVYQALQTGVVDGQENTWSNIYTQKMHEVQKYITSTNHGYIGYVVVTNKKFWDGHAGGYPRAMRKGDEGSHRLRQRPVGRRKTTTRSAEIKKTGKSEIVTLTPEQDAAMRKALEPVYQDVAKRVGQPLIDEFLKETRARPTRIGVEGLPCVGAEALLSVRTMLSISGDCGRNGRSENGAGPSRNKTGRSFRGKSMLLRILDRLEEILIAIADGAGDDRSSFWR